MSPSLRNSPFGITALPCSYYHVIKLNLYNANDLSDDAFEDLVRVKLLADSLETFEMLKAQLTLWNSKESRSSMLTEGSRFFTD